MAFTLAHPAAAIPLARRGLVMSALIVGSMAPDFAYYLHLSAGRRFGHSLPGMFLFSLPMGLVVLWVFQVILKRPLLLLLPVSHQQRLAACAGEFPFGPFPRFVLIVLSLMAGIVTHVVWDAVTHVYGWTGRGLDAMGFSLADTPLGPLRLCDSLHFGSTLVAMLLLCWWYARWYAAAPVCPLDVRLQPSALTKLAVPCAMGLVACLVAVAAALLSVRGLNGQEMVRAFIMKALVVGISAVFVQAIVFSALIRTAMPKDLGVLEYWNVGPVERLMESDPQP